MKPFFSWNTQMQHNSHITHASRGIPDILPAWEKDKKGAWREVLMGKGTATGHVESYVFLIPTALLRVHSE
jgi:hypothetical protein